MPAPPRGTVNYIRKYSDLDISQQHGQRNHLKPMGLIHGAYCLGCCWILMGLLFLGGVMNLLWIAGITLFVLLEKITPFGVWGARAAGITMIAVGIVAAANLR